MTTRPRMQQGDLCLVTGGSGYVATWIEKYLLEGGYRVRGTIRSLQDTEKLKTLQSILPGAEFVEADLRREAGWQAAVEGCKWVFHVASPQAVKEESDRVGGAVAGTRHVLNAAFHSTTVKKVVMTSSEAAVAYGHPRGKKEITEDDWSDMNVVKHDYMRSKTLAEREAWAMINDPAQNPSGIPLSTICPVITLGPSLIPWSRCSLQLLQDIADGTTPGVADMTLHLLDVRDCARMHIVIMADPATDGHRHLAFGAVGKQVDMGLCVQRQYPDSNLKPTTRIIPTLLVWLLSFVLSSAAAAYWRVGVHLPFQTKYPSVYKYEYTSISDIVHAGMETMIAQKWIDLKPRKQKG